jgi:ELWxxDGT repeat protein
MSCFTTKTFFHPRRRVSVDVLEPRRLLAAAPFEAFTTPGDALFGPSVEFNGAAYFFARDATLPAAQQRAELWKSDGTPAGTVPTGVSFPAAAGADVPAGLVVFDGRLLFDATDPQLGRELWLSDGTPAGTVAASAFDAPAAQPLSLTVTGDQVYFTLQDAATGRELWRTDGTPAGTRLVIDLNPGPNSSNPTELTPLDGRLFFIASDTGNPRARVWSTDGTPEGTAALMNLYNPVSRDAQGLLHAGPTPDGPRLFISAAPTTAVGAELWLSDGTAAGTRLVKDITAGTGSSSPSDFVTFNDAVYFVAHDWTNGREVWRSDGTADGTVRVTQTRPGGNSIEPTSLTPAGDRLFFVGALQAAGLWSTDGTEAGTRQARSAGTPSFLSVRDLRAVGDRVFFVPTTSPYGGEPWVSDGTPEGTLPLRDVHPGNGASRPVPLALAGGRLVFAAHAPQTGAAPWVTDGTPEGTTHLLRIAGDTRDIAVTQVLPAGDRMYAFASYLSPHLNREMRSVWATDGTAAGTRQAYADHGALFSQTYFARTAGGKLFFGSYGVWVSDGTPEGSRMLHAGQVPDNHLGTGRIHQTAAVGDTFYFAILPSSGPKELWKTDGTPAGTVLVKRFDAGVPSYFRALGDRLVFTSYDPVNGYEPWVSDGTEEGTVLLKDVNPGPNDSGRGNGMLGAAADGKLYFIAADGTRANALWVTDGTTDGTRFVKDLVPGSSQPFDTRPIYAADGNVLYFQAPASTGPMAVWRTDGTEAGTRVVAGRMSHWLTGLATWGGALYIPFSAGTGDPNLAPGTMYRSDGTPAGTVPVRSFQADPVAMSPRGAHATPHGVYFVALTGSGRDLWRTDGTPAGTVLVYDAATATGPETDPSSITPFAGGVWFVADGRLWTATPPLPRPAVVARHVFYNNSAADGNDPTANAADDAAVDAGRQVLLPGRRAVPANVTSYSRGINGVMVDLSTIPAGRTPAADDFELRVGNGSTWTPLAATPTVAIRRGAGVGATDRVTLTLPDGLVKNTWLRVTVKANADTGLSSPDVFYVGNLIGDAGGSGPSGAAVNRLDLARTRARVGSTSGAARALFDFNRDGVVNTQDYLLVRQNQGRRLNFFTAPSPT